MFGANPAPPFGSAPAFGSSTPAFGASSAPSFGFGSAPAVSSSSPFGSSFGAASTPAFGASTATQSFGSTTSSSFSFSAPSFPPSSTPGFGAPAPTTFGAATSAPFGAPLFGGTSGTTFGQSSASLFGTSTVGSTFGQPAAGSAPSLGFGAFGSTPGFGSSLQPATQQGLFPKSGPASYNSGVVPTDTAVKELTEIKSSYTPGSPTYRFQYLFLNVVDNPAQRVKPANVDEVRWRQAMKEAGGPDNPDRLWPVLAVGFKDLVSRSGAQAHAIEENSARLRQLAELAHRISRKHETETKDRIAAVQRKHLELSHRLLHFWRHVDALEGRLASNLGYRADLSQAKVNDLSLKLNAVETQLASNSASSMQWRLSAVSSAARLQTGAPQSSGGVSQLSLDESSLQRLFALLKEHVEAVGHLQSVVKQDQIDVEVVSREACLDQRDADVIMTVLPR